MKLIILLSLLSLSCAEYNNIDISEPSLDELQSVNLARQESIQDACKHNLPEYRTLDQVPPKLLNHILIDTEHKLLYCYVPKVACTNWKRVFMILTGKWNSTDPLSIPPNMPHKWGIFNKLCDQTKMQRDFMLKNYHKMILVRNPFERILSAYRNKLEGNTETAKQFQKSVGRNIIKFFRENPSEKSLANGNDVTFEEFARFLTERPEELTKNVTNEHWHPITDLCHPCLINYTLVGKYETLMDDARLALHTIKSSHIQFPRLSRSSITAGLLPHYSQFDKSLITRLYNVYKRDFGIFNYTAGNIIE